MRFLLTGGVSSIDAKYEANPSVVDPSAPAASAAGADEEEEEEDEEDDAESVAAAAAELDARVKEAQASGVAIERWLPDTNWQQIVHLAELPAFAHFDTHFKQHARRWRGFYESSDPASRALPGLWESKLSPFQKLLVLRLFPSC